MDRRTAQELAALERHIQWLRDHIGQSRVLDKRLAEISRLRASVAFDQKPTLIVVNPSPFAGKRARRRI